MNEDRHIELELMMQGDIRASTYRKCDLKAPDTHILIPQDIVSCP